MDEEGIGSEAILTHEGILKRFNGGETVFNSDMVDNIWNFSQDPSQFISGLSGIHNNMIDLSKTQPVKQEQKIEVNMNIGGVLDEAAARVLNNEFPNMIKKHQRQIGTAAYKDMKYMLYGK